MDKMIASSNKFNVERVKQEDVAKIGGAPPDEEGSYFMSSTICCAADFLVPPSTIS